MSLIKHIFITGGVTSSLGKGIIAASLGRLLKARGYQLTIQKFDPYINIDPGTMNPTEHGECFVTADGAETDLDLGHYERFLGITTTQKNNITTGRVYHQVITKERRGDYLGKTVQVIPHITDEIKRNIFALEDSKKDIIITEIGGCVGDIESLPFIEAIRQVKWELREHCLVIHLTLLPYLQAAKELKTKPTQHSVKKLLEAGIQPDMLICRTAHDITPEIRKKIALFCNVSPKDVIAAKDVDTIYAVPLHLHEEGFDTRVLQKLALTYHGAIHLEDWRGFLRRYDAPKYMLRIGIIGKYIGVPDAYKSIVEALQHAGTALCCKVQIIYIDAEKVMASTVAQILSRLDGVLVAPGFGTRGIAGKIHAIRYVRENHVPFLGICLGMQCAVVEFAQNVLGFVGAASTEYVQDTPYPVIHLMENQQKVTQKGGSMRLGNYPCQLLPHTKVWEAYDQKTTINERHRHRYEFNTVYLEDFEQQGMRAVGINPDHSLVEIMTLEEHPFFVGTQFHPEYQSRVLEPHPLLIAFLKSALLVHKKIYSS